MAGPPRSGPYLDLYYVAQEGAGVGMNPESISRWSVIEASSTGSKGPTASRSETTVARRGGLTDSVTNTISPPRVVDVPSDASSAPAPQADGRALPVEVAARAHPRQRTDHLEPRPVDSALGGGDGDAERGGDVPVRPALDVAKDERGPGLEG